MTTRYITTNSAFFNQGTGDTTYEAQGVVITGGIDMRYQSDDVTFNGGGNQTIYINGGLFGSLDDYWGTTSGNDRIFVGSTGYIDYYWFGAINLGGGGHSIVNQGTISTSTYANAILITGSVGANTTSRTRSRIPASFRARKELSGEPATRWFPPAPRRASISPTAAPFLRAQAPLAFTSARVRAITAHWPIQGW